MHKFFAAMVAAFFLQAGYAADSQSQDQPLVATALASFVKEADQIRQGMKPGGHYEFIKEQDKQKVENRLDQMEKLLQAHSGAADMNQQDKIQLVNAQEEVNAILKHNDSNRLVCESRAPVGSHIPVTTCKTYGQIESERSQTNATMRERDRLHPSVVNPQSH